MPKLNDKIAVSVRESLSDGVKRKIIVEIEAAAELLTIPDILAKEDAIEALPQRLRKLNKEALSSYIQSGKALLKSAAKAANLDNGTPPKSRRRRSTPESSGNEARVRTSTQNPI